MHELNWGLPVIGYLFLAGAGAGAVTVSASVTLRKGGFGETRFAIARYGALVGPLPVMLGTFLIVFELGQPFRSLNLYKLINLSPMSIGSWLLAVFIILCTLYAASFLPEKARPGGPLAKIRRGLAWICLPFGIGVAVYTGILLGAMPSRPFWNSPVIPAIFLFSALSGGVASIVLAGALFRKPAAPEWEKDYENSSYLLTASDALLLSGELIAIFLFLMFAHLTVGDVRHAVDSILPGGRLAAVFWGGVVLVGILIPFLVELFLIVPKLVYGRAFRGSRHIEIALALAVLIGGFALRYVIVIAGQITAPSAL